MTMGFGIYFKSACGAALTAITLSTAACAPKHYTQLQEDSILLSYENRSASEVLFASSIDRFQLHPATRAKGSRWEIRVPMVKEFTYFYLVDSTLTLPDCQLTVFDDFGAKNCFFDIEL